MPIFKLTIEKAYYKNGFFNVKVEFDQYVRPTEGSIELIFRKSGSKIEAKVNRSANRNGTARIMGGAKLREWFTTNCNTGDIIDIEFSSLDSIRIG